MLSLCNLDVDWRKLDNGVITSSEKLLGKVLARVSRCDYNADVRYRRSASGNGFHVQLECLFDCDECRMVFDSGIRFDADILRPEITRAVLWDEKWYYKGGVGLRLEAGDWVRDPTPKVRES